MYHSCHRASVETLCQYMYRWRRSRRALVDYYNRSKPIVYGRYPRLFPCYPCYRVFDLCGLDCVTASVHLVALSQTLLRRSDRVYPYMRGCGLTGHLCILLVSYPNRGSRGGVDRLVRGSDEGLLRRSWVYMCRRRR